MKTFNIRPVANRDELEACYDLWGTVFSVGRAFFQKRLDFDEEYEYETTWAAFDGTKIAAAIQIFPYQTQVDGIDVLVGGIGSVATSPEYRGLGLAQTILNGQVGYMRNKGYDFSLLFTGIFDFYKQVGWGVAHDAIYSVATKSLPAVERHPEIEVLAYSPNHQADLQKVYESCNAVVNGARRRTDAYWRGMLKWSEGESSDFLVAQEHGQISAYVRTKVESPDKLRIVELCSLPGHDAAALSLIREAVQHHPSAEVVQARVPDNHPVARYFTSCGGQKEDYPGSMWRPISLLRFLERLKPVLFQRVQGLSEDILPKSGWRLLFQTGNEQILLAVDRDGVDVSLVEYPIEFHKVYAITNGEWVDLLFKGVGALRNSKLKGDPVLTALFPNRPAQLWEWDFF